MEYARRQGFSLVEMLVVTAVLGVVLSMVTLTLGAHPGRAARTQAEVLLQWLQVTRERAVLEGREYGISLRPQGWQVQRLTAGGWVAVGQPLVLPDGLDATLTLSGEPVTFAADTRHPHLLLMSSDEMSPFRLRLYSGTQLLLSVSSDGFAEATLSD